MSRGRPKKIIPTLEQKEILESERNEILESSSVVDKILTYKDGNRIYNLGEIVMLLATEQSIYELKFDKLHLIDIKETPFGRVTTLLRDGKLFRRI